MDFVDQHQPQPQPQRSHQSGLPGEFEHSLTEIDQFKHSIGVKIRQLEAAIGRLKSVVLEPKSVPKSGINFSKSAAQGNAHKMAANSSVHNANNSIERNRNEEDDDENHVTNRNNNNQNNNNVNCKKVSPTISTSTAAAAITTSTATTAAAATAVPGSTPSISTLVDFGELRTILADIEMHVATLKDVEQHHVRFCETFAKEIRARDQTLNAKSSQIRTMKAELVALQSTIASLGRKNEALESEIHQVKLGTLGSMISGGAVISPLASLNQSAKSLINDARSMMLDQSYAIDRKLNESADELEAKVDSKSNLSLENIENFSIQSFDEKIGEKITPTICSSSSSGSSILAASSCSSTVALDSSNSSAKDPRSHRDPNPGTGSGGFGPESSPSISEDFAAIDTGNDGENYKELYHNLLRQYKRFERFIAARNASRIDSTAAAAADTTAATTIETSTTSTEDTARELAEAIASINLDSKLNSATTIRTSSPKIIANRLSLNEEMVKEVGGDIAKNIDQRIMVAKAPPLPAASSSIQSKAIAINMASVNELIAALDESLQDLSPQIAAEEGSGCSAPFTPAPRIEAKVKMAESGGQSSKVAIAPAAAAATRKPNVAIIESTPLLLQQQFEQQQCSKSGGNKKAPLKEDIEKNMREVKQLRIATLDVGGGAGGGAHKTTRLIKNTEIAASAAAAAAATPTITTTATPTTATTAVGQELNAIEEEELEDDQFDAPIYSGGTKKCTKQRPQQGRHAMIAKKFDKKKSQSPTSDDDDDNSTNNNNNNNNNRNRNDTKQALDIVVNGDAAYDDQDADEDEDQDAEDDKLIANSSPEERAAKAKHDLAISRRSAKRYRARCGELETELAQLRTTAEETDFRLSEVQYELDILKHNYNLEMESFGTAVNERESLIEKMQQKVEALKRRYQTLDDRLQESIGKEVEYQAAIEEAEGRVRYEQLQRQAMIDSRVAELESQLATVQADARESIATVEAASHRKSTQIEQLNERIVDLEQSLQNLIITGNSGNISAGPSTNGVTTNGGAAAVNGEDEFAYYKKRIDTLTREIDAEHHERQRLIDQYDAELKIKDRICEQLRDHLRKDQDAQLQEKNEFDQKYRKLATKFKVKEREIASLQAKLQMLNEKMQQSVGAEKSGPVAMAPDAPAAAPDAQSYEQLLAQFAINEAQMSEMRTRLDDAQDQLSQLNCTLQRERDRRRELESSYLITGLGDGQQKSNSARLRSNRGIWSTINSFVGTGAGGAGVDSNQESQKAWQQQHDHSPQYHSYYHNHSQHNSSKSPYNHRNSISSLTLLMEENAGGAGGAGAGPGPGPGHHGHAHLHACALIDDDGDDGGEKVGPDAGGSKKDHNPSCSDVFVDSSCFGDCGGGGGAGGRGGRGGGGRGGGGFVGVIRRERNRLLYGNRRERTLRIGALFYLVVLHYYAIEYYLLGG